jgi:hypothetical protein
MLKRIGVSARDTGVPIAFIRSRFLPDPPSEAMAA